MLQAVLGELEQDAEDLRIASNENACHNECGEGTYPAEPVVAQNESLAEPP